MSSDVMRPEKICVVCGEDCSTEPRTKDAEGRYYHRRCESARRKAPRRAPVVVDVARNEDSVDLFEGMEIEVPARSSARTVAPTVNEEDDGVTRVPCPACQTPMRMNDVICMACGHNTRSGRPMKTKRSRQQSDERRAALGAFFGSAMGVFAAATGLALLTYLIGVVMLDQAIGVSYAMIAAYVILRIAVVLEAYTDGVTTGLLVFFLPIYDLYYVYAVSDNDVFKGLMPVALVCAIAARVTTGL